MRISELAAASGVSIPTIKYYLREHLIPAGDVTSATRASYDERHVEALRLVRSLHTAGLSVAESRRIVELIAEPVEDAAAVFDVLLAVHQATSSGRGEAELRPETRALADRFGWDVDADAAAAAELQAARDAVAAAGFEIQPQVDEVYARCITEIARAEVLNHPSTSLAEAVRYSVLGAVLLERVLLAMRRLAGATIARQHVGSFRPEGVAPDEAGDQASEISSA